jgi:hypothetical protein
MRVRILLAGLVTLALASSAVAEEKPAVDEVMSIEKAEKERDEAIAARDEALQAAGQCNQARIALALKLQQLGAAAAAPFVGQ